MSRKKSDPDCVPSDSDDSDDSDNSDDEDIQEDDIHFYPICCHTTADISASHATLTEAVDFDLRTNKFDLLQHLPSSSNDQFFEKAIICINKSRTFVSSATRTNKGAGDGDGPIVDGEELGKKLNDYLKATLVGNKDDNNDVSEEDEKFYRPFLTDDAFLLCMEDLKDLIQQRENVSPLQNNIAAKDSDMATGATKEELQMRVTALQEQLTRAKACITSLAVDESDSTKPVALDNDTYYFNSYSHSSIHETMLQDKVRTNAYKDAILLNSAALFKDKIVIDLGCGTGILSLFAAKAGAKKVIAIDASDIYTEATEIVNLNGYSDVITVLHGKVEDLIAQEKLPLGKGEKANVIISEWMGYALFFETMLPSVLKLRDSCMDKRNGMGTMFPNGCSIMLEGASDFQIDYWDDVYGMKMHPMKTRVAKELKKDMAVEIVQREKVVTGRATLKDWNLNECSDKELDFSVPFELKLKEGRKDSARLDKLVVSFDIAFDLPKTTPVHFSTGCQTEPTHWKQTTVWIDPTNGSPTLGAGEVMKGTFQMGRNNTNHRDMDFLILWEIGVFNGEGNDKAFTRRCGGTIVNSLKA